MFEALAYIFIPTILALGMTHLAFQAGLVKGESRVQGIADALAVTFKILKEELGEKEAKRIIEKIGEEVRSRFQSEDDLPGSGEGS